MEIPIPFTSKGKIYRRVEIKKPSPAVLADTKKIADEGNYYFAMQTFISGCIESLEADDGDQVTSKDIIRQVVGDMPFRSADYLSIQMMLKYDGDDGIEGVYECPRCHKKMISEVNEKLGIDNRDFISELQVKKLEGEPDEITIELDQSVDISFGEMNDTIRNMTFRHPNLKDCNRAWSIIGSKDQVRYQLQVYVEAMTKLNGKEVDNTFRKRFGLYIFEKLDVKTDINKITNALTQYGMETKVKKHCRECGKEWLAAINTANFFVSGLQPV